MWLDKQMIVRALVFVLTGIFLMPVPGTPEKAPGVPVAPPGPVTPIPAPPGPKKPPKKPWRPWRPFKEEGPVD